MKYDTLNMCNRCTKRTIHCHNKCGAYKVFKCYVNRLQKANKQSYDDKLSYDYCVLNKRNEMKLCQ